MIIINWVVGVGNQTHLPQLDGGRRESGVPRFRLQIPDYMRQGAALFASSIVYYPQYQQFAQPVATMSMNQHWLYHPHDRATEVWPRYAPPETSKTTNEQARRERNPNGYRSRQRKHRGTGSDA